MKRIFFIFIAFLAALSCSEVISVDDSEAGRIAGEVASFAFDDATKTYLKYDGSSLKFYWRANDKLAVFGNKGKNQQIPLFVDSVAGDVIKTTAEFNISEDYALMKNGIYVAYHPVINESIYLRSDNVPFDYEGQVQKANDVTSTDHLGDFDFMVSLQAEATATNGAFFQFKHQCCPLWIHIDDVPAGKYKSVSVKAGSDIFVVKGIVDIFNVAEKVQKSVSEVSVSYENSVTVAKDGTLDCWVMMHPVNLTGKNISVIVTPEEGNNYEIPVPAEILKDMVAGKAYKWQLSVPESEDGFLPGIFSTLGGKKIRFSKGNLWCDNSNPSNQKWYFENNQYDHRTCDYGVENYVVINGAVTSNPKKTMGLFAWSCDADGVNYGTTSDTNASETGYNGNFVDWGKNPIENGGRKPDVWRTIRGGARTTNSELYYLFEGRSTSKITAGILYKYITIVLNSGAEVGGLMLLPDEYTPAVKSSYSVSEWAEAEKAGAVFFPETGIQSGKGYYDKEIGVTGSKSGHYWTSFKDPIYSTTRSYSLFFNISMKNNSSYKDWHWFYEFDSAVRYKGFAVRLVQDVE